MATDRLQAGEKMRVYNTLTRIEADITSLLGMNITTELCHQKCRRTQASISHNQAGIYIREMGGGRRQYGMGILSISASAVSFRV